MFCGNCGNNVPDGFSFCPNCGANIAEMKSAPDETIVLNEAPIAEPVSETTPVAEPVAPEAETTLLGQEPVAPAPASEDTVLLNQGGMAEEPAPAGFQSYEQPLTSAPAQVLNEQPFQPIYGGASAYEQPVNAEPAYAQPEPTTIAPENDFSTSTLVWGILSVVLSELGIFGIIFGIVARVKAKKFLRVNGTTCGKSRIGSNLGMVGIIVGIIMTIFWIIFIAGIVITYSEANRFSYGNFNFYY